MKHRPRPIGARVATCRQNRKASATPPAARLAVKVTDYRLALELARAALRLGRTADALAHLDDVLN